MRGEPIPSQLLNAANMILVPEVLPVYFNKQICGWDGVCNIHMGGVRVLLAKWGPVVSCQHYTYIWFWLLGEVCLDQCFPGHGPSPFARHAFRKISTFCFVCIAGW